MNLLLKLKEKLAKVAMAGVMLAATIVPAACTNASVNPPPGDDPTIEKPTDSPTATHSQLLYDVIGSSYYMNLINENNITGDIYAKSQVLASIPYGFLEKQGFDINAIKNDDIQCSSIYYKKAEEKANNIYVSVKVENKAKISYYTCYTLKYNLTDLEYSDLEYASESYGVEAPLMIQELSYQKTPTIEGYANMYTYAYKEILEYMTDGDAWSTDLFGTTDITMDVLGFSTENNTLECAFREDVFGKAPSEIKYAHLTSGVNGFDVESKMINNVEVYIYPYPYVTFQSSKARDEYRTTSTPIRCYNLNEHRRRLFYEDLYNKTI